MTTGREDRIEPAQRALTPGGSLLRIATAGSVDDGKSTLIGRLLYDSKSICDDHLRALMHKGGECSPEGISLALLTDGLKSEREQLITIDVAYRYFSTENRHFILADAPGHEQYTRNMVTAASSADVLVILIDATKGVLSQTRRHAFIGSLMAVPRFLVVVNKMDLMGYRQDVFERISDEFFSFSSRLATRDIRVMPIAALQGDNVVSKSENMPWYSGETVLQYLENIYTGSDRNLMDLRFPVQCVIRPHQEFRGYAGRVASGVIRKDDEIMVLPSGVKSRVSSIQRAGSNLELERLPEAAAGQSVVIELADNVDIGRGDVIVRPNNTPRVTDSFEAIMVWMGDEAWNPERTYVLQHGTCTVPASISEIRYAVNTDTLHREKPSRIEKNEVFCARILTRKPICADDYRINRATGGLVLIDTQDNFTVAAGMIVERRKTASEANHAASPHLPDLHREEGLVKTEDRTGRLGHPAFTVWMTGLSGAGKSTISRELEARLFKAGYLIYRIDGDNLRFGLNCDLGFSPAERSENIRRAAEVAALMNAAGVSVICTFISPFAADRETARRIIGEKRFVEVYVKASLETCEARDPHGLYAKARRGEIPFFTGITSPYEVPKNPAITVDSGQDSLESCVEQIERSVSTTYPLSVTSMPNPAAGKTT